MLYTDMDFRVLTSDDDKWAFDAWSSAPDHVMRFVDDCISRIEQRPTDAWDVAAEMCFSTEELDDDRAAKLAKLRAQYDTSEPAGIMNPERVVNKDLKFAPAWLSQDGMDLPTPTVVDDAFKEKLLSHFGLTLSGCPLDCSEKITDPATQGETHRMTTTEPQRQALVALLLKFAHLFASSDATLQPEQICSDYITIESDGNHIFYYWKSNLFYAQNFLEIISELTKFHKTYFDSTSD